MKPVQLGINFDTRQKQLLTLKKTFWTCPNQKLVKTRINSGRKTSLWKEFFVFSQSNLLASRSPGQIGDNYIETSKRLLGYQNSFTIINLCQKLMSFKLPCSEYLVSRSSSQIGVNYTGRDRYCIPVIIC